MIHLPDFELSRFREVGEFVLYRGRHLPSGAPILIRAPSTLDAPGTSVSQLEHEWSLALELDSSWAVRPVELIAANGCPVLVLEDTGGVPLNACLRGPLPPEEFLRIAIRLCSALRHMHQRGLVHKDIKPENFFVDASGDVRLTGFGVASLITRLRQSPVPPERASGTLEYMAPEQTGRMNRSIDARSDLYALGVTLYELLTGTLPFTASEPMEWIHAHIARQPVPPGERSSMIPASIAEIVLKLLAKMAEDRYQTAHGLQADLEACLAILERHGRLDNMQLGAHDIPEQLLIPENLYGRQSQIATLIDAFHRVARHGASELLLVSGYSGIGKSSVVHEFRKDVAFGSNLFAAGKFDQYKRDIPYATLAQAFQALIRQLLAKSETELGQWRSELRDALGNNGQLIVNLIPDLALIIGEQVPVAELSSQDAQARFYLVFRRFLQVFARPEHPLTLFLDDLQWLDAATLNLLERLAGDAEVRHLLLIAAYRDNEVTESHPLSRTLQSIRESGARVQSIVLAPLTLDDVASLLGATLHQASEQTRSLAEVVVEKSGGNPFFAIHFVTALAEDATLGFDQVTRRWCWDIETIQSKKHADNVVDLMLSKLNRLEPQSQEAMKTLACLGDAAPRALLAAARGCSGYEIDAALWTAVRAGLIIHRDGDYTFLHDRIQEAAYALIPDADRMTMHLNIGRVLLAQTPPEHLEERIFEIVNQLDRALPLMNSPAERLRSAELNLIAGRRARISTAYASALRYLQVGESLLDDDAWVNQYALKFSLELQLAECEFLTGDQASAQRRLAPLIRRAAVRTDRAAATFLQVTLHTASGDLGAAIDTCLDYLREVGIDWPTHPSDALVQKEFEPILREITDEAVEGRLELSTVTDPEQVATLDVLAAVLPPAFFTDQRLVCLVLCRMANLSRTVGNTEASALGYAYLGMVLGPFFGNSRAGYRFGRVGLDLVDTQGLDKYRARVYMTFAYHVLPYSKPMREGRTLLRRAFDVAQEVGDLTYTGFSCCTLITNLLASGDPLYEVEREAERALAFVRQAKFGLIVDIITTQLQLVRALRGRTSSLTEFDDLQFDDDAFCKHLRADRALAIAECWYWIRKLQLNCVAGEYAAAIEAATCAEPLLWTTGGHLELAEYHFYGALALAGALIDDLGPERGLRFSKLSEHARQLDRWAADAPENFTHRAALVNAEIAFIEQRDLAALRLYEEAIVSAREQSFLQVEALAHEAAARFCRSKNYRTIAHAYLRNARSCYARLDAYGKVTQLETTHPTLRTEVLPSPHVSSVRAQVDNLDLDTLVRGSRAVSGQIGTEKLIHTLMTLALEHAGAQRGLLISPQGGELWVQAEALTTRTAVEVQLLHTPVSDMDLPQSIVFFVVRTQEAVLLDAASAANAFSEDSYLSSRQPQSVLCLPLVKQGKLIGVLYLENKLTRSAFTPARVAILNVLASQAANALEGAALEEKEALLREIHHRVKNNLQLISSLLNLQAGRVSDPAVAELFTESRHRVRSMALVHENLYRAGSFARVAMSPHIQNLCAQLLRAYEAPGRQVRLEVQVDDVQLDVERAVPCGLIVNELVVNSLKHAFADRQTGYIRVTLSVTDADRCRLSVEDDGKGIAPESASEQAGSMGFQLIHDLAHQLRGTIEVTSASGTRVVVMFPLDPRAEPTS